MEKARRHALLLLGVLLAVQPALSQQSTCAKLYNDGTYNILYGSMSSNYATIPENSANNALVSLRSSAYPGNPQQMYLNIARGVPRVPASNATHAYAYLKAVWSGYKCFATFNNNYDIGQTLRVHDCIATDPKRIWVIDCQKYPGSSSCLSAGSGALCRIRNLHALNLCLNYGASGIALMPCTSSSGYVWRFKCRWVSQAGITCPA
mmetsp:Transcript_28207/g.45698  ORF Transcript_28207/g.45698 Transcript_28207/m.45698 type:complete len:206 (+) Transcript_28207:367-984(+)